MLADLFAPALAVDDDVSWFADRRRQFRFRPAFDGEADMAGPVGVLVSREGGRMFLTTGDTAAAFDLGESEHLCGVMWRAMSEAGFPITAHNEKAAQPV